MTVLISDRITRLLSACIIAGLPLLAGCEKIKATVRGGPDLQWQSDSTVLAARPRVVYRMVEGANGQTLMFPLATAGTSGLDELHMGNRGWRAFDVEYLHRDNQPVAIRHGRPASGLTVEQGMWEPTPADTTFNACNLPVPFARVTLGDPGIVLAMNASPTPLRHGTSLSDAELEEALQRVPLLIAPTSGISTTLLSRFERKVYQVTSGSGPSPTLVVVYNDPEPVADSITPLGQRPRHLIVVLDKGLYGYKPTWTYKSIGNRNDAARLRFLDYADVTGDGLAELFFAHHDPRSRATIVLRFETDVWREHLKHGGYVCEY